MSNYQVLFFEKENGGVQAEEFINLLDLKMSAREALINCPCGRIASLRGARNLNIFLYMPRFLRSVRLALHPAQAITQSFPKTYRKEYLEREANNDENI